MTRDDVVQLVFEALREINRDRPEDHQLPLRENTPLLGAGSRLDSLGLVQLIVEVEHQLATARGVTLSLTSDKAMSQRHSPFLTIRSLVDYVLQETGA